MSKVRTRSAVEVAGSQSSQIKLYTEQGEGCTRRFDWLELTCVFAKSPTSMSIVYINHRDPRQGTPCMPKGQGSTWLECPLYAGLEVSEQLRR